jgi:hypothetical protein
VTKKKLASLLAGLALASIGLSGCVYAKFRTPLDRDLDRTQLGSKTGSSEFQSILWLVAWGDAGTHAAAQDGGITTINHADLEILSVLFGLYYRQRTILYGD